MTEAVGYYSIIQYCPDPSRMEAANVGVVLFCPSMGYLKARTAKGNDRIRRFFRPKDLDRERLNATKLSIQRRLEADCEQFKTIADLEHFAATRANAVRLTPPAEMLVGNPEEDLKRLFERLVGGRCQKDTAQIKEALDQAFQEAAYQRLIMKQVTVTLPVFHRPVTIPYAFKNGRINLLQPVRFQGLAPSAILQRAGQYAIEGDLLYETPDPKLGELQLVVVGQFGDRQTEVATAVDKVLERNHTEMYRFDELGSLLEEIRRTGKPLPSTD